ncbi:MAG: RIP metalloprotease RseP [Rhizomicrobium sp.]
MIGFVQDILSWALPFILMITPVVFFHELGHFTVARFFGVKIETFSIGFGSEIFGWTDRKGTRWKLSWIPVGGYVKFFGDADAASVPDREKLKSMSAPDREGALEYKPLYQRALIVAAGPVANFVLAIVVFVVLFLSLGEVATTPFVGKVEPGSAAAGAGIQSGDLIKAMNGKAVKSFEDVRDIILLDTGDPLAITLERHGHGLTVHATPRLTPVTDRFGDHYKVAILGILPDPNPKATHIVRLGPIAALEQALGRVGLIVKSTWNYRLQLVSGAADASQLSGPVGIVKMSHDLASIDILALVNLAALISVSVGLVNLFPIPILDGGHLLYYGCEAVLGRPLSARTQDLGFRLGLAVVLGLMVFATWNDLVRLNLF